MNQTKQPPPQKKTTTKSEIPKQTNKQKHRKTLKNAQ